MHSLQNDAPAKTARKWAVQNRRMRGCYPEFKRPPQYPLRRPSAGGRLAMEIPARTPLIAYLLVHVSLLRRRRDAVPAAAERLAEHAVALELLAEVARDLPEDDERLQMLVTLAVRHGQFVPGPAADHAPTRFVGTSREACDTFLTTLARVARDDALGHARDRAVLPPNRPRCA